MDGSSRIRSNGLLFLSTCFKLEQFVGLSIGGSVSSTLYTDLLPHSQHGFANGISGVYSLVGCMVGFGVFIFPVPTWACLFIYGFLSVVLLVPVLVCAKETRFEPIVLESSEKPNSHCNVKLALLSYATAYRY